MISNIKKYTYDNNIRIITCNNDDKILIKNKKKHNIEQIYKYLNDHNIDNYISPIKITDKELYFNYIEKPNLEKDELAKRLIHAISIMQAKTTTYKEIDKDKLKEKYDQINQKLIYLYKYYQDLQDIIENKVYMMPSEYLFIRNVSIIYQALNYAHNTLEKWYEIVKEKKTERFVYCHGKCELDHFIARDDGYFISLEKAHLGSPIEDFLNFYNKNYADTDMISNFNYYQHKYSYTKDEILFLLLNITIPEKINIYNSSLNKCIELVEFFDKLKITSNFILNNQKYHETNKEHEFNK